MAEDILMTTCWGSEDDGHIPFYPVGECPQHRIEQAHAFHKREVEQLGKQEMTRREARQWADAVQAAEGFRDAPARSLAEAIRNPIADPEYSIQELLPFGGNAMFSARFKAGKLLDVNTPMLTSRGWSTMGDLVAGDHVFGSDGKPTRVTHAHPFDSSAQCYRVEFSDGRSIVAGEEHQWTVWSTHEKKYLTLTTGEMLTYQRYGNPDAQPHSRKDRSKLCIDIVKAIQTPDIKLPMDPYLLGLWLGDGSTNDAAVTTMDHEVAQSFIDGGYPISSVSNKPNNRAKTYRYSNLRNDLRAVGVFGNKHIPDEYLNAGTGQRAALLAGLMDSDGGVEKNSTGTPSCNFTSTLKNLSDGAAFLARSLGRKVIIREGRAKLYGVDHGPKWTVSFYTTKANSPFRLMRHTEKLIDKQNMRSQRCAVKAIVPVEQRTMRCISVDATDQLYAAGRDFILTHNSTLVGQLAMAYADGTKFLGKFQVYPPAGKVCIWNYELNQSQFERWLGKMPIQNPERIIGFHARGLPHPLQSPKVRDRVVERLIEANCGLWIVDPLSRALAIGSVNDDSVVAPFLAAVEEIKERAGIRDLVLVAHMGHGSKEGEKRAMGSSALSGWGDALWMLTKDDTGDRFFSGDGRDVDIPEGLIEYDPDSMTNVYIGGTPDDVALSSVIESVMACVRDRPEISKRDVRDLVNASNKSIDEALLHLQAIGDIKLTMESRGRHSYSPTNPNDGTQEIIPTDEEA